VTVADRPFCADVSAAAREPLGATASRIEHWILVEYAGMWPRDPLDAAPFASGVRRHLEEHLAALPHGRLLLVKQPGRASLRRTRVFVARTAERGSSIRRIELPDIGSLTDLDFAGSLRGEHEPLGEAVDHPLLAVCTHGKRDRCCARLGQPLCMALHRRAPQGWLWQSSHVGGDRFAGNLVCLPEGLYFGRVARPEVDAILAAYRSGRIDLDHYRGRSCYPFPVQAAELAVRRELGLTGFWDLRLRRVQREADGWSVELAADVSGLTARVEVTVERGEPAYLTCNARQETRPRVWVARSVVLGETEETLADEPADEHQPARVVERPG
jgi:hypothetical protein